MAEVGLRVNEARHLDLADIKWDLGLFGKLHVRKGKGARGSGPRERMVPLINDAGRTLRWFVEDAWAHFGDDHTRVAAPLLPSERKNADGSSARVGDEALRSALADAAARHLPDWPEPVTPLSCAIFARASSISAGWTWSRSKPSSATPGSPPPCTTSTSTAPTSKTPGSPVRNAPRTV